MLYEITFQDRGPADVEIRLTGAASPEDFRKFMTDLEGDPRFRAGLALLVDVSELEAGTVSDLHLADLASQVSARDWDTPPLAVAIVAASPEIQEKARLYRASVGGSRSNRHVVGSRSEGLAWLAMLRSER